MTCGREHTVPRRFPSVAFVPSREAALYVARPEAWPAFLAHLRSERAEVAGDMTDEQLLTAHRGSAQLLTDILSKVAPEFLVLRDIQVGSVVLTAETGDRPPGVLTLGLIGDDGGLTTLSWLVVRSDAEALAATWREQVGEPDAEAVTDCAGGVRIQEIADGILTVMTPESEHGE
jgi:hypothetical protein